MMKKFAILIVVLACATALFFRCRSKAKELELNRYRETAAIMDAYTTASAGVSVFTNVLRDAWGRDMAVAKSNDMWVVISQGHDQNDNSDDIILMWNTRCGRIDIHYEHDGCISDRGRTEEVDCR